MLPKAAAGYRISVCCFPGSRSKDFVTPFTAGNQEPSGTRKPAVIFLDLLPSNSCNPRQNASEN
jgi:hypothetical protein